MISSIGILQRTNASSVLPSLLTAFLELYVEINLPPHSSYRQQLPQKKYSFKQEPIKGQANCFQK